MTSQRPLFARPEQSRSNDVIRQPFETLFSESKIEIADNELRRVWAADAIPDAYAELTQQVWTALIQDNQNLSLTGSSPIVRQGK